MTLMRLLFLLMLILPSISKANNYCNVPHGSPTHGMSFEEIKNLAKNLNFNVTWECGLLKNLYKLADGHTDEPHYKNAVVLLDGDDFGFVSQGQVGGLTVYAKTDRYDVHHYVALQGLYPRMRLLTKDAIGVTVERFENILLPNGDVAYIPILARAF